MGLFNKTFGSKEASAAGLNETRAERKHKERVAELKSLRMENKAALERENVKNELSAAKRERFNRSALGKTSKFVITQAKDFRESRQKSRGSNFMFGSNNPFDDKQRRTSTKKRTTTKKKTSSRKSSNDEHPWL